MSGVAAINSVAIPLDQDSYQNNNVKSQEFEKILETKVESKKNIIKSHEPSSSGTNIALKKEMKQYSIQLERYMLASMWRFAYESAKEKEAGDIAGTLYGGQYISQMVEKAYGEEGGPLSEALYEKLLLEFAKEVEHDVKGEEKFDKKF